MTGIAVARLWEPYRAQRFDLLDGFVTLRAQSVRSGRQRKIGFLFRPNIEIVIVVMEISDDAEQTRSSCSAIRLEFVTDFAIV